MTKPIINVSYGIASSYKEGIEIHKLLEGNLRKKIIKHEQSHDSNSSYTRKDLNVDFNSKNSYFFKTLLFAMKHPTAWVGFFPFMYSYYFKEWTFNWSVIPPFLYFGAIFSGFWWLIFHINPVQSIICYVLVLLLLNVFFIVFTHITLKKLGLEY